MKTILQVEDDPNDVFFLKHALKKVVVANLIQIAHDGLASFHLGRLHQACIRAGTSAGTLSRSVNGAPAQR